MTASAHATLLLLATLLQNGGGEAAKPDEAAVEEKDDASGSSGARDLVSIARREAERELEQIRGRVRELLKDLQQSSDHTLGFIQTRIEELMAIGPVAIPLLVEAMNFEGGPPGASNAASNAARAIAGMEGREALTELTRLTREGNANGRRFAAFALGLRGDPVVSPALRSLLADSDPRVVVAAIHALGRLIADDELRQVLAPLVSHEMDAIAAAAIETLADHGAEDTDDAVLDRLVEERGQESPSSAVARAAFSYFVARPNVEALPLIEQALADTSLPVQVRERAVEAARELAREFPRQKHEVLAMLKSALSSGPRSFTESVAMAMHELGDDSGISVVTAPLDEEIDAAPKNVFARYQRGELFLRFKLWKAARRDFNDGYNLEKKQPRDPERVYMGLARAYAGLGDYRASSRWLEKLDGIDRTRLPRDYPEFRDMAEDPRYKSLFE